MSATDGIANDIKVSVCMITYNHEAYIAQAIESVLMQETDFPIELVIGEDCSTDGTRAIVLDYAARYPDRIRPLLPETNLGMIPNFVATWKECRGRYVALLEGDDYWTDPLKLQKQVAFLEAYPNDTLCFHLSYRLLEATGEMSTFRVRRNPRQLHFDLNDLLSAKVFPPTASVLLRNHTIQGLPAWYYESPAGDWPLFILYAQQGNLGMIDEYMSVYRIHDGGTWSSTGGATRERARALMTGFVREHLGPSYDVPLRIGYSTLVLGMSTVEADRDNMTSAKRIFMKGIIDYPMNRDMRIIEKLALFTRLYIPPVYRALKQLQSIIQR